MASGKRASMREGPLSALFRGTEEGRQEPAPAEPATEPEARPPEPPERAPARTPTPQERLRHAFSSDLPDNMMAPARQGAASTSGPRRSRISRVSRSCGSWASAGAA
jgi:cell division protein FtsZ